MKCCPKCGAEYLDNTLEFCLEDGSHLSENAKITKEIPTIPKIKTKSRTEAKTAFLPEFETHDAKLENVEKIPDTVEVLDTKEQNKVTTIKEKVTHKGFKIIEVLPIIIALLHNYWHWIYFDKARFYSFLEFILSGTVIVWFFLLLLGVVSSLIALKFGKNKGFAITALVILAINLLLGIVPLK